MDKLLRGLVSNKNVRVFLANTTELVEEARKRHDLWPTSAAALGRCLSVTCVLGAMLKSKEDKLSVEINGGGPIGTIMCDAFPDGKVRGFCGDPHIMLVNNKTNHLDVGMAVGNNGYLRVIKDISLKDDFTGTVNLQSGEIGEDFAYYFTVSEQTPTAVSVGVLVNEEDSAIKSSGVLVIQMLPSATEEDIVYCENIISKLKPMSSLILEESDVEKLAHQIFDEIEVLDISNLEFYCGCSKKRMSEALLTVTENDLKEMIEKDKGCEITCRYCNNRYQFNEKELKDILNEKRKKS